MQERFKLEKAIVWNENNPTKPITGVMVGIDWENMEIRINSYEKYLQTLEKSKEIE
jgi:hypothetical protein